MCNIEIGRAVLSDLSARVASTDAGREAVVARRCVGRRIVPLKRHFYGRRRLCTGERERPKNGKAEVERAQAREASAMRSVSSR